MTEQAAIKSCDVLVIGGGIAGAFAAIRAREAGAKKVIQVDKGWVGKSGESAFAAGVLLGVAFPDEDINARIAEASSSNEYFYIQDRVKSHFEKVWEIVQELDRYGSGVLKTSSGEFERAAGRGHRPVLMFPGNRLMDSLSKAVAKKGVEQVHKTMVVDLLTNKGQVSGAVGFNIESGDLCIFRAKATVMSTGSTYYKGLSPGHRDCSSDGSVAAFRAGAVLSSAESDGRQGHAFAGGPYDIGPGMSMYVGLGGVFINRKGEKFMGKYYPVLKDRAELTVLTQSFAMEARQGNTPIYLDMTHFTPENIAKLRVTVPLPIKMLERAGFLVGDKFTRPIEWMITSPFGRPGIEVDAKNRSSLPGLYGGGESTAVQSFAAGLVGCATHGAEAGKNAAEYAKGIDAPDIDQSQLEQLRERIFAPMRRKGGIEPHQVLLSVQEAITPYDVWQIKHEIRLIRALEQIEEIREEQVPLLHAYDPHYLRMAHEAANLVFVAEASLRSAIFRKESRVGIREDYPYRDNVNWLKWTEIVKDGDEMKVNARDVPVDTYPYKLKRDKLLHPRWEMAQKLGIVKIEQEVVKWV